MKSRNCPQQQKGQEQEAFHIHRVGTGKTASPALLGDVLCVCTVPGTRQRGTFCLTAWLKGKLERFLLPQ